TDFWVIACGKEKPCAPRALVCDGDDLDSAPQPTRTRSAVEISIAFEAPECVCGCNRFDPKGTPGEQLKSVEDRIDAIDRQKQDDEHDPTKPYVCGMDPYDCYTDHYAKWECPSDCGCGTACACGCCVLLARVHWAGKERGGWRVLQEGVRRFIRPCL